RLYCRESIVSNAGHHLYQSSFYQPTKSRRFRHIQAPQSKHSTIIPLYKYLNVILTNKKRNTAFCITVNRVMIMVVVLMGGFLPEHWHIVATVFLSEKGGEPMLVNERRSNWSQLVPVNNILPFTPRTVGSEGHEPRPPAIAET